MRVLVQCPKCRRQFDASRRKIGSRFRCPCGTVVEVRQPQPHDASVVRCSACGAPRSEHATRCSFCGSDFTLHEQDLDTVCPSCLARVSDQAQFCHHCGAALVPEAVTGEATELECPACRKEHTLSSRRMGDVAALECGRCAGLWLGNEVFRQLTFRASKDAAARDESFSRRLKAAAPQQPDGPTTAAPQRYRPCVVCHELMNRRNYGYASGAIVDFCREHGIWFDADELPRILEFIHNGGLLAARAERPDGSQLTDTLEPRRVKQAVTAVPLVNQPEGILEAVVQWLKDSFTLE